MQLTLTLGKRLTLLACLVIVAFIIISIISGMIVGHFGIDTRAVRILTVMQDLIVFILPAVATAMLVTRRPATLLAIDTAPDWRFTALAALTLVASIPLMNAIVTLNEALPLPENLADTLLAMERQADSMINAIIGPRTIPNLIMAILIIGILAGLSEEILFRGALQRLLSTGGIAPHAAIWTAAAIFSLVHMEILGFIPRLLLGAFFGYTLLWGRSLWTPVILHTLNNTLYLLTTWESAPDDPAPLNLSTIGSTPDTWPWLLASLLLTLLFLRLLRSAKPLSAHPSH